MPVWACVCVCVGVGVTREPGGWVTSEKTPQGQRLSRAGRPWFCMEGGPGRCRMGKEVLHLFSISIPERLLRT